MSNDIFPMPTSTVISVAEQVSQLNYQYMRMMLVMSAILFFYVVFNFLFRFDTEKTMRIGKALDTGMIVVSSFILVISIIYFTRWY